MKKLRRLDDLTKALGYLKLITEKYNADFTAYISCHGSCDSTTISINVGGYGNKDTLKLDFELNTELASDNKNVLKELQYLSENGFDSNEKVLEAKNKALESKRQLFEQLKKEFT